MDYRLEVTRISVSDVDRAKAFYQGLGWRLDADADLDGGVRCVQMTPPGSACSVSFGSKIPMEPELIVSDSDAARKDLMQHGAAVSEPFHRDGSELMPSADPEHKSYSSYASFKDPRRQWLATSRGHDPRPRAQHFAASGLRRRKELEAALRRAAEAYGRHVADAGQTDENWPAWYAHFMVQDPQA
jgi:catechol 2,3-dioxygenase-like lactoylglutathione lyase family enzyme